MSKLTPFEINYIEKNQYSSDTELITALGISKRQLKSYRNRKSKMVTATTNQKNKVTLSQSVNKKQAITDKVIDEKPIVIRLSLNQIRYLLQRQKNRHNNARKLLLEMI